MQTKEDLRHRLGIPRTRRVFLAVSHFRPVKQLDRLIYAFSQVSSSYDFTLLLVGKGDEEYDRQLRTLAKSTLAGHQIIFHPYVQGEALRDLYWAADVFVSASSSEGGPVVTMEALACSLPVLTTPAGRAYEVMRRYDVGSVLAAGKYDRWPSAIRDIFDHGLPRVLNREIASAEFDWRSVAEKFVTLLDSLNRQFEQSTNRPELTAG
jgi:glycosyltransferase involved in cell wall biosynthesis